MTDAALTTRLDALAALAEEPSSERRRELLREATEVFFAPRPPAPEVMALFEAAVEKLTGVVEAQLRADLSERLAPLSSAPRRLVQRLIGDEDGAVAAPLLARSSALTSEDLLRVASTGGQVHLRAVSTRSDLTEAISDRIVERGDDTTLGVLVANESAPLSRVASERVVSRAMVNPALHEAVVGRSSLPVDLLNQMYTAVEARLRQKILARNAALPPEMLEEALSAACTSVAQAQGVLPADYAVSVAYVDRLLEAGPIAAATLASFAKGRQTTRLAVALSRASGVDVPAVLRVLDRGDADAFALVCRAAGYDEDLFAALATAAMPGDEPVNLQVARFNALSRDAAGRVVRFWKVRQSAELQAA
ncbi:MAG: DUF2336 domain-containing protein [Caulobacteraceae bacterium]|nr:DUF2336 domain-containing protein [Caulobacter sp.]